MGEREDRLIAGLVAYLAAGKLDFRKALPALRSLTESGEPLGTLDDLLAVLAECDGAEFVRLSKELKSIRLGDAQRWYENRVSNRPVKEDRAITLAGLPDNPRLGWRTPLRWIDSLKPCVRLCLDRRFLASLDDETPVTSSHLAQRYSETAIGHLYALNDLVPQLLVAFENELATASAAESNRSLISSIRELADKTDRPQLAEKTIGELREQFASASTGDEKRTVLDQLCLFPDVEVAKVLREIIDEPSVRERAQLILTCRFGNRTAPGWDGWKNWLTRCERRRKEDAAELDRLITQHAGELLLMWVRQQSEVDPELITGLNRWCSEHATSLDADSLVERWSEIVPADEWNVIVGVSIDVVEPPKESVSKETARETILELDEIVEMGRTRSREVTTEDQPGEISREPTAIAHQKSDLWSKHLQPFLVEQWYLVAGVVMVLAGSSLLAYFTWDKHWLVRYTLMPMLLGSFTWTLAWLGGWIERQHKEFQSTAAILRGAAIGLLPINFMAVAVLSNDEQVLQKSIAVPVMGAIYLMAFGYGLRRWCAEMQRELGWLLGGTLLLLNSLVMLGPLANTVAHMADNVLLLVIGVGFHLGFLVMAGAVSVFTRNVLTRELAEEQRIPWFFGGTLMVTFVQVFVWVHGYLRHVPKVSTYAAMVILMGWLVLLVERRALQLRDRSTSYRGESFVGFALVLLGVMMGIGHPHVRILGFLLSGIVWLNQSRWREEPLHDWIGLTLLTLGGASIGLLDGFPSLYLPALGLALAIAMGAVGHLVRRIGCAQLRQTCLGMQAVILMLTTVVAVLAQWHDHSDPLITGGYLLLIVVGFGFRAWRDNQLRWIHSAMTIVAIALPYLGCVDFEHHTLRGNVMPFGLASVSILWLLLNHLVSGKLAGAENSDYSENKTRWQLIRDSRSTVLWVYGSLAVAAMVLRVLIERDAGDLTALHMAMDYSGPLMMTVVLAFATWYSRSLIPAGMAAVIVIILFPEIKATFASEFKTLGWGTGLGGAISGFAVLAGCFALRNASFLKNLGEGDRFMGQTLFPIRRHDHTLFTWPLLASALFLTIRTDTFTLFNQVKSGIVLKTAIAIGFTAFSWMLLAVYWRRYRWAELGTYIGCIWVFVSIELRFHVHSSEAFWIWPVLCWGLAIQGLYLVSRFVIRRSVAESIPGAGENLPGDIEWPDGILVIPFRRVLDGSSIFLSLLCILGLMVGEGVTELLPLIVFLGIQIVWHGLKSKVPVHGGLLFALAWTVLLSSTTSGSGPLAERLSFNENLLPMLFFLFGIQAVFITMETDGRLHKLLRNIADPCMFLGSIAGTVLLIWGLYEVAFGLTPFTPVGVELAWQLAILAGLGLITARGQSSPPIALLALLILYAIVQVDLVGLLGHHSFSDQIERVKLLFSPWRLTLFSVVLALLEFGCSRIYRQSSRFLTGPYSQPFFQHPDSRWFVFPALGIAVLATLWQNILYDNRHDLYQLSAPFLAAAAWGIAGWSRQKIPFLVGSGVFIAIGNIHGVTYCLGDYLREYQVSEIQLICLGLALSLLELTAVRLILQKDTITKSFNQVSLGLAGFVLVLLSVNYFTHPNLSKITPHQFIVSGSMAYLAGLYFRRAARQPMAGEEPYVNITMGMYHFGVTVALWCVLLLIPIMRTPALALIALGLPTLYFYLRAEMGIQEESAFGDSYRNSATVLGFAVLIAYVFRFAIQMVLFPTDSAFPGHISQTIDFYHSSAPFIMLLSIVLLRLHGLGGTSWLALYGGLALVTGSYFTLTWLPELQPFEHPIAGAFCAIAVAHFWTLVSNQRSPLRTAIQRLAKIDEQHWFDLRRVWGFCVLAVMHGVVLCGLFDWQTNSLMVAPLLAGAASVLIHQGVIRRDKNYFLLATFELLVALHADFLVESYLFTKDIIWVLLSIWIVFLVIEELLVKVVRNTGIPKPGTIAAGLAGLMFAHILYHHPWSNMGLGMFAASGVLAALTPRSTRRARTDEQRFAAALLCIVPAWLAFFSQTRIGSGGLQMLAESWLLLVTVSAIFLTGLFARVFQTHLISTYDSLDRARPRLFDQTLSWFATTGTMINTYTICLTFFSVGFIQVLHHGQSFRNADLILIMALYAGLTVAWFYEGQLRRNMASYIVLQLSVLGFFAVIRHQLILTTAFWILQYDVWTSLIVSCALTGTKQYVDLKPKEIRIPLLGTLLGLPVVALVWALWNDLGTDVTMLVVGLHSLMFVFMGKDDRESPYNLVAIAGFVAFTLMLFWTRLDLRVIHAYTIPVGIGVLTLLQLFRHRIDQATRNSVRLVTLLAMIGSVGCYALLDPRYPIAFHLTMVVICLASMGLGSFFRIRLYVIIGFGGLLMDVSSVLYRVIIGIEERSTKMTIVGSLVLIVGASLIFGAIYYKTHKKTIDAKIDHWRKIFGDWE